MDLGCSSKIQEDIHLGGFQIQVIFKAMRLDDIKKRNTGKRSKNEDMEDLGWGWGWGQ